MSKNKRKLYIGIFIAIVFSIIISLFIYTKEKDKVIENITQESLIPSPEIKNNQKAQIVKPITKKAAEQETNKIEENTQSVTILAGNIITHLPFIPNTLFYDALVQGKNDGKIAFNGKNYPGLGFFVTDIGPLHAGSGKYLLYYINGKEATVGVSLYKLKDGDIIEWKLE